MYKPTHRINATPERCAALEGMLHHIYKDNRRVAMEARQKIQEAGGEMPLVLMTMDEFFAEMKRRSVKHPKVVVRSEDL